MNELNKPRHGKDWRCTLGNIKTCSISDIIAVQVRDNIF